MANEVNVELEINAAMLQDQENAPLVSVCITTYNHAQFIEDCLNSVLSQEVSFPFEILIYDDNSTDETLSKIQKYQAIHPEMISIYSLRRNMVSLGVKVNPSFNFTRARGKYIAICDGDDYWGDAKKLSKQVCAMESDNNIIVCYGPVKNIDQEGRPLQSYNSPLQKDLSASELRRMPSINASTAFFKNVFRTIDPNICISGLGDQTYWARLSIHGGVGKYLEHLGPTYKRVHSEGNYSMNSEDLRAFRRTRTALYLYRLYEEDNDKISQEFYAKLIVEYFLQSTSLLVSVKLFIRKLQYDANLALVGLLRRTLPKAPSTSKKNKG